MNQDLQINIREMNEKDLDEVYKIELSSFSDPWEISSFKEDLNRKNAKSLVIEVENKIVGYIIFWIISDEIHILNIAVHRLYRKQKIATALLKYCFEFASLKSFKYCTLEVRENNLSAQKLYEKFGFKPLYKRKKYYSCGEDAVVMGIELCDTMK